ncbi:MAG: NAD-dependent epimerase/dehydratase family protein, partial [Gemmatimonadota bacterium]|nr:NAD-dependent epimerase/dehydratase family protein [Gemmatimonadota bacterium]
MIVVAGASGFIGRALCAELESRGLRITRVGRRATSDIRWPEPGKEFGDEAVRAFAGARAVVSLVGEPISERWTAARQRAHSDTPGGLSRARARA